MGFLRFRARLFSFFFAFGKNGSNLKVKKYCCEMAGFRIVRCSIQIDAGPALRPAMAAAASYAPSIF